MVLNKEIVLIHGTWCDGNVWGEFATGLRQMGYKVHTPSFRYHDLPYQECLAKVGTVTLQDYRDDLVALIESLDQPPLILGHSLGCLVAQMVAEKTEVAGMILMGPAPTADIYAFYPTTDPQLFYQSVKQVQKFKIERIMPGHHELNIPVSLINTIEAGFAQLERNGQLKQGNGLFEFGEFQIQI